MRAGDGLLAKNARATFSRRFTSHNCSASRMAASYPQPRAGCDNSGVGRIFEVRKHAMFARWNRMAKQFARIGKDITIAVKTGGPDPSNNPAPRRGIQNARAINMPKDKIED